MSLLNQALKPRYDINVKPNGFVLPNRAKYVTWVDKAFKYGKPPKEKCLECEEGDDCEFKKTDMIDLFPHQKFIKDYLQFASPYRGMLLFFGLGSGKSAASIAAAEILMNQMDVIVMLPASLRSNYIIEVRKYGRYYFQLNQYWEKDIKPSEEDITKLRISPKLVKKHKGLWIPDHKKASNFTRLNAEQQKEITDQTHDVIENRFNFINFDGLRRESIKKMVEHGNPFDNKCIVIDEVHNLISRIVNQGVTGKPIYNLLMTAKNCKLILLSGTPVINYPSEVAYLVNILTGYRTLYQSDIIKGNMEQFEGYLKNYKYIDYFQVDKQKKKFSFTILPDGFTWQNNKNLEVSRTSPETVHEDLKDHLKQYGVIITDPQVQSATKKAKKESDKYYKALPEDDEVFNAMFVDMENAKFKNQELFMRRILGTVSFYSSYSLELFPSVKINEVPISMPKYMFSEYQKWRMEERNKERGGKPAGGNIFKDSGQVYRFYSRAIGNFTFPKEIKRIFPSDLRKIKNEIDDIDGVVEKAEPVEVGDVDKKYRESLTKAIKDLKATDHLDISKIKECSPKFFEIINKIEELNGTALVYSQFREVEGLGLLCAALDYNGYAEFKIKKNENKEWDLDIREEDYKKPKYFQFRGNSEETQILLRIFNSDLTNIPNLIREKIEETNNYYGDIIKVIMITQSGSEGISLKNVRQVHILEPFWNHIRIDQVIGRAVRTCSHVALKPKERNVEVFIYYVMFTNEQINESFTIRVKDKSMTSDQYLYDIAKRKKSIVDSMLDLMKRASVDCAFNAKYHSNLRCFSFPVNIAEDKFTFTFDMSRETYDNQYKQEIEEKNWKGQVLVTKKGRFLIRRETNEVYDYDIYVDAGRLTKLGQLVITDDGKRIIKMREESPVKVLKERTPSPVKSIKTRTPSPVKVLKERTPSPVKSIKTRTPSPVKSIKTRTPSPKRTPSPVKSIKTRTPTPSTPSVKSEEEGLDLGFLNYKNNSCYLDTFLVSIMHKKDNNIIKNIMSVSVRHEGKNKLTLGKYSNEIKDEFKKIYNIIQKGESTYICTKLRDLFTKYDKQYIKQVEEKLEKIEWMTSQQEPRDVINIIDRVLNLKMDTVVSQKIDNGDENKIDVLFNNLNIDLAHNKDKDEYVKDYLPINKEKMYNQISKKEFIKETTYLSTKGLFVNILRGYYDENQNEVKSKSKVIPLENVKINDTKLDLVSMIVHHGDSTHGGHYTCYIKNEDEWYHFDDMKDDYKFIGKFSNIPTSALKNSVALVYL
jgi:hypothetical protein